MLEPIPGVYMYIVLTCVCVCVCVCVTVDSALATVLIQHGTLRPGDVLVAGVSWCKVRTMQDHTGQKVTEATPSTPVLITGWKTLPTAGDVCYQASYSVCVCVCVVL